MTTSDTGPNRSGGERATGAESCASVRDLLPLHTLGVIEPTDRGVVDGHLEVCSHCRAEAELVVRLQSFRPAPPASIRTGVLQAAGRSNSDGSKWVRWAIPTAAAAAAVLAFGVFTDPGAGANGVWTLALEQETSTWVGNEWVVAGQPVPEALPDDVLRGLLEELQ